MIIRKIESIIRIIISHRIYSFHFPIIQIRKEPRHSRKQCTGNQHILNIPKRIRIPGIRCRSILRLRSRSRLRLIAASPGDYTVLCKRFRSRQFQSITSERRFNSIQSFFYSHLGTIFHGYDGIIIRRFSHAFHRCNKSIIKRGSGFVII